MANESKLFIMRSSLRNIPYIFLLFSNLIFSQQIADFREIKERYQDNNVVRLSSLVKIKIDIVEDQLKITRSISESNLFLNENAKNHARESVSYSSFIRLNEVEASTQYVKGDKYYKIKVDDFLRKNDLDGSFHDDVKKLNFIYPKMGPGSITNLQTQESILNPRFLGSFYFGGYYPVLSSRLEISVDNNVKMDFKQFNVGDLDIQYNEDIKRNRTTYSWEVHDVRNYEMEMSTPNYKNYYPHMYPLIKGFHNSNGDFIPVSSSVNDLYQWYHSLTNKLNKDSENPELTSLVNALVRDSEDEKEKVRAIYYWVQNNIKYIDFEYGLGGFIPREASKVYNRKFGDCKDNSNLLREMLRIAGIKSSLTWIGTRSIPYSYEELPTPVVDNHMILQYRNKNEIFYLDATGRYLPLEYPSSFIQGKEALVGISKDTFKIQVIPETSHDKNRSITVTNFEIGNGFIEGQTTKSYRGYPKMNLFYELEDLDGQTETDNFFKGILELANNKFAYDNLLETNKFSYDQDYQISCNFKVDDIVTSIGDEIMINMNLDKSFLQEGIDEDRKTDIEKDFKHSVELKNTMTIPEGYIIEYLPENLSISNNLIDIMINYKVEDNKVLYEHKINLKYLILPQEEFSNYNKIVKSLEKAYKEQTVLKKIK